MGKKRSPVSQLVGAEVKKRTLWLILGFTLIICSTALSTVGPVITRHVVDDCLPSKDLSALAKAALLYAAVYIASQIVGIAQSYLFTRVSNGIQKAVKPALVERAIRSDPARVNRIDSGDFVNRIGDDADEVISFSTTAVVDLATQAATLILSLAVMFDIDWRLALIILAAVPCVALSNELGVAPYSRRQKKLKELRSEGMQLIMEAWANRKTLRYGRFVDYATARLNGNIDRYLHAAMGMFRFQTGLGAIQSLVYFLPAYALLFLGGSWVIDGSLTIGSIVAAMSFMSRVYSPVSNLLGFRTRIASYEISKNRLEELVEDPLASRTDSRIVDGAADSIRLRDIRFTYEAGEAPIFDGATLEFRGPGIIPLKGGNGSGKTTLIDIISGYARVDAGTIEIEKRRSERRRGIVFLPQENAIFRDTIRGNVLVGRDIADDFILSLARQLGFDDFGRGDLKLDRAIGDQGGDLSGGQKRKIVILRALLEDAQILVLDEPFSGLDSASKVSFRTWLQDKAKDRLIVLVDHEPGNPDGTEVCITEHTASGGCFPKEPL